MRAQIFEQALRDIVTEINNHLGDGVQVVATDRKTHSDDRTVLAKIRRLAEKAVDRTE